MIQLRNVPDDVYRELTRRAKAAGLALSDYVQSLLEREVVSRPPAREVFERIANRTPIELSRNAAELLRQERQDRSDS